MHKIARIKITAERANPRQLASARTIYFHFKILAPQGTYMPLDRRSFLAITSSAGLASTLFPGTLYTLAAQAQATGPTQPQTPEPKPPAIPQQMIDDAADLAGITVTAEQSKMMLDGLNDQRKGYDAIRKLHLPNSVAPAYVFDPLPPGESVNTDRRPPIYSHTVATIPANLEDVAFYTVPELADLVRRRKVSSLDLTQ